MARSKTRTHCTADQGDQTKDSPPLLAPEDALVRGVSRLGFSCCASHHSSHRGSPFVGRKASDCASHHSFLGRKASDWGTSWEAGSEGHDQFLRG